MWTRAIYEGIKERHRKFAKRMEADGLKPIGFLGGGGKPNIVDYELETKDTGRVLRLHVLFPKHPNPNIFSDDDFVTRIIPLPIDADDRPAAGKTFSLQVNSQVFTGTVVHRGDLYHIHYEIT